MGPQPVAVGSRAGAAEFRQELLGRLGLRNEASDQDVEAAHDSLVDFLERAPHGVRSWATSRITDVDLAFALLSGPEEDLKAAIPVAAAAQGQQNQVAPTAAAPAPSGPPAPYGRPAPSAPRQSLPVWAVVLLVAAGLVLVLGVVFGVYKMGSGSDVPGISGTPTNQTSAPAAAAGGPTPVPVDAAKVADLTKKVASNPKDIASLQGLGDAYFAAADYKKAAVWEQKVLHVDAKNQVALLAVGAAQFNLGNAAEAKKQWLVAAALYPKVAEVHYDLGFLYMSQTPPDTARMTAEWKKVVAIDPNSNLAKTVATHLSAKSPVPSASATPSAK